MPQTEKQQPTKTVAEIQQECDRIAIVDYDAWISACRLMALREYSENMKRLNYGGISPNSADSNCGDSDERTANQAPYTKTEANADHYHCEKAQVE